VSVANFQPSPSSRTRDRRSRNTFWIDDRVIDDFAPVMRRYSFGAVALAVYAVLARRADREGDSWPSLGLIAAESGSGERTVQRALRLLELLQLVEISTCYDHESQRQTSNLYTLLTPPEPLPEIDPDPRSWQPPRRRTLLVRGSNRSEAVATAHGEQHASRGERPTGAGLVAGPETETPRTPCTLPPAPGAPQEGNTREGNSRKEGSHDEKDGATARRLAGQTASRQDGKTDSRPQGSKDDASLTVWPSGRLADFAIPEIGLTNRQVWAATLGELVRRGEVGRTELESWLRPAALIGRDGETLVIGAPNAVTRERIATRLLPAVREALAATIGAPVAVSVIVAAAAAGDDARPTGALWAHDSRLGATR
jgi:hypothetical protein